MAGNRSKRFSLQNSPAQATGGPVSQFEEDTSSSRYSSTSPAPSESVKSVDPQDPDTRNQNDDDWGRTFMNDGNTHDNSSNESQTPVNMGGSTSKKAGKQAAKRTRNDDSDTEDEPTIISSTKPLSKLAALKAQKRELKATIARIANIDKSGGPSTHIEYSDQPSSLDPRLYSKEPVPGTSNLFEQTRLDMNRFRVESKGTYAYQSRYDTAAKYRSTTGNEEETFKHPVYTDISDMKWFGHRSDSEDEDESDDGMEGIEGAQANQGDSQANQQGSQTYQGDSQDNQERSQAKQGDSQDNQESSQTTRVGTQDDQDVAQDGGHHASGLDDNASESSESSAKSTYWDCGRGDTHILGNVKADRKATADQLNTNPIIPRLPTHHTRLLASLTEKEIMHFVNPIKLDLQMPGLNPPFYVNTNMYNGIRDGTSRIPPTFQQSYGPFEDLKVANDFCKSRFWTDLQNYYVLFEHPQPIHYHGIKIQYMDGQHQRIDEAHGKGIIWMSYNPRTEDNKLDGPFYYNCNVFCKCTGTDDHESIIPAPAHPDGQYFYHVSFYLHGAWDIGKSFSPDEPKTELRIMWDRNAADRIAARIYLDHVQVTKVEAQRLADLKAIQELTIDAHNVSDHAEKEYDDAKYGWAFKSKFITRYQHMLLEKADKEVERTKNLHPSIRKKPYEPIYTHIKIKVEKVWVQDDDD